MALLEALRRRASELVGEDEANGAKWARVVEKAATCVGLAAESAFPPQTDVGVRVLLGPSTTWLGEDGSGTPSSGEVLDSLLEDLDTLERTLPRLEPHLADLLAAPSALPPTDLLPLVGRESLVAGVAKAVEDSKFFHKHLIALMGPMGVGKCSVVRAVASHLGDKCDMVCVDVGDKSHETVMGEVVHSLRPCMADCLVSRTSLAATFHRVTGSSKLALVLLNARDPNSVKPLVRACAAKCVVVTFHSDKSKDASLLEPILEASRHGKEDLRERSHSRMSTVGGQTLPQDALWATAYVTLFTVDPLGEDHATHLARVHCPRLSEFDAGKVAKACSGLPLAVIACASTLKAHEGIDLDEWLKGTKGVGGKISHYQVSTGRDIPDSNNLTTASHVVTTLRMAPPQALRALSVAIASKSSFSPSTLLHFVNECPLRGEDDVEELRVDLARLQEAIGMLVERGLVTTAPCVSEGPYRVHTAVAMFWDIALEMGWLSNVGEALSPRLRKVNLPDPPHALAPKTALIPPPTFSSHLSTHAFCAVVASLAFHVAPSEPPATTIGMESVLLLHAAVGERLHCIAVGIGMCPDVGEPEADKNAGDGADKNEGNGAGEGDRAWEGMRARHFAWLLTFEQRVWCSMVRWLLPSALVLDLFKSCVSPKPLAGLPAVTHCHWLMVVGECEQTEGRNADEAAKYYAQAFRLCNDITGNHWLVAFAQTSRAEVLEAQRRKDLEKSIPESQSPESEISVRTYRKALAKIQETGITPDFKPTTPEDIRLVVVYVRTVLQLSGALDLFGDDGAESVGILENAMKLVREIAHYKHGEGFELGLLRSQPAAQRVGAGSALDGRRGTLLDPNIELRVVGLLGSIYKKKGEWPTAIKLYDGGLKLCELIDDGKGLVEMMYSKANMFFEMNMTEEAVTLHEEALEQAQSINNPLLMAKLLLALGQDYCDLGQPDQASASLERGRSQFKKANNAPGEARCWWLLAKIHMARKDQPNLQVAASMLEESARICEDINDRTGVVECYMTLGEVHEQLHQPQEALRWYAKCHKNYDAVESSLQLTVRRKQQELEASLNQHTAVKTGWLTKQGGGRSTFGAKTWHKRWFCLTRTQLTYSKQEANLDDGKDPAKEALNVIYVKNILSVNKVGDDVTPRGGRRMSAGMVRAFLFEIHAVVVKDRGDQERRALLVQAESDEERSAWVEAIQTIAHSNQ